jgi:hypothetical protein
LEMITSQHIKGDRMLQGIDKRAGLNIKSLIV